MDQHDLRVSCVIDLFATKAAEFLPRNDKILSHGEVVGTIWRPDGEDGYSNDPASETTSQRAVH